MQNSDDDARQEFGPHCCGLCIEKYEQGLPLKHGLRRCEQVQFRGPVPPGVRYPPPLRQQQLVQRGPPPPPPPPPRDPLLVKREGAAERMKQTTVAPLEFEVVEAEGVAVRDQPLEKEPEIAHLPPGSIVRGYCGADWLRLTEVRSDLEKAEALKDKWVCLGTEPPALVALCLQITVRRSFAEAVDIFWQEIPRKNLRVNFNLRCKRVGRRKRGQDSYKPPRHDISKDPEGIVSGLPLDQPLRFRVVAECSGIVEQTLFGPWSQAVKRSPLDESISQAEDALLDRSGTPRGSCVESSCKGWISCGKGKEGEEDDRCARCGHTDKKHKSLSDMPVGFSKELTEGLLKTDTFRVKHGPVNVLDWPDERGRKIGELMRGATVSGTRCGPWLCMPEACHWARVDDGLEGSSVASASSKGQVVDTAGAASKATASSSSSSKHVFMFGAGRSGTNLLADLLGMHSELTSIYETEFVTEICDLLKKDEEVLFPEFRKEVLRIMEEWTRPLPGRPGTSKSGEERYFHGPHHLLMERGPSMRCAHNFIEDVRLGKPLRQALAAFLDAIFDEHARKDGGKRRVVNKTPDYATILPILEGMYPEAKFINCLRDGRAVAHSVLPRPSFGPNDPVDAPVWWMSRVEVAKTFSLAYPDRLLDHRYEDLVRRPRQELSRVLTWLGLPDESSSMLRRWRRHGLSMRKDRIGAWRDSPAEELKAFKDNPHASVFLRCLGYAPDDSVEDEWGDSSEEEGDEDQQMEVEEEPLAGSGAGEGGAAAAADEAAHPPPAECPRAGEEGRPAEDRDEDGEEEPEEDEEVEVTDAVAEGAEDEELLKEVVGRKLGAEGQDAKEDETEQEGAREIGGSEGEGSLEQSQENL